MNDSIKQAFLAYGSDAGEYTALFENQP